MFIIPNPFQIILDDLGWFCGSDDRPRGGPSRTAMPRCHVSEDYAVVNKIGEAVGMKINCAFILGEWDPDNRLRSIPYLSKFGDRWDNASHLDMEEAKRCAEVINNSPYIDIALHGLTHGYYMDGVDNKDMSDYYYKIEGKLIMADENEVRARIDAFFEILNYYGIKKKVNSVVPPTGDYRWNELSNILREYGIEYLTGLFWVHEGEKTEICGYEKNGMLSADRATNLIPWYEVDTDPSTLPADGIERDENGNPKYGVFGMHWPNFLNRNPQENDITAEKWIKYIKGCDEQFTTFVSPDLAYACHQLLYLKHTKVEASDGCVTLDLSDVPSDRSFRVNMEKKAKAWSGCDMCITKEHDGFTTYEISPKDKIVKIEF